MNKFKIITLAIIASLFYISSSSAYANSYGIPPGSANRSGGTQSTFCVNEGGQQGYNSEPIQGVQVCSSLPLNQCVSSEMGVDKGKFGITLWRGNALCVDFHGAMLQGKDFRGYMMMGVNLEKANLKNAQLKGANLDFSELYGADFSGANLSSTNSEGLGFALLDNKGNPWPRGTSFAGADASRSVFKNAILHEVDLSLGNFSCANFEKADLSKSVLINGIFSGAYFVKAKLNGAKIGNSSFKGVNLSGADLTGIVTSIPSFDGVDPSLQFAGAIFDNETKMPWSREKALSVGMVEASTVKQISGFPGISVPTRENCDIEERR